MNYNYIWAGSFNSTPQLETCFVQAAQMKSRSKEVGQTCVEKLPQRAWTLPRSSVRTPEKVLPKSKQEARRIRTCIYPIGSTQWEKANKPSQRHYLNNSTIGWDIDSITCIKLNYFHIRCPISWTVSWGNIQSSRRICNKRFTRSCLQTPTQPHKTDRISTT